MSEENKQDMKEANQAKALQATILMSVGINRIDPVVAMAALSVTLGDLLLGMTLGLNDEDRNKAVESYLSITGPLIEAVRTAVADGLPKIKAFEAARAAKTEMGGGRCCRGHHRSQERAALGGPWIIAKRSK